MKNTVVTVVCQYGSGGECIAKRLAEALAIPFYDRESLLEMAKTEGKGDGFRKESVARGRRLYALVTGAGAGLAPDGATMFSEDDSAALRLTDSWKQLSDGQSCVIAAEGFAPTAVSCVNEIRVYIGSDREDRVRRVASEEGIAPSQALRRIARQDKRNDRLCLLYTGQRNCAPDGYAICINGSFLGIDGAVEAIRGAIDRRNKCG